MLARKRLAVFYKSVVRPVLEYACVVWQHNLTVGQCDRLEALQKRALLIILHPITLSYTTALAWFELDTLKSRRSNMAKDFFQQMCQPDNCLHGLLPPERDSELLSRLRHPLTYPLPNIRTKRYCSFVNYALRNYQQ